jgi:WD40 repeat protein
MSVPPTSKPRISSWSGVLRVFGEPRFHTDGDLLALAFGADDSLWSVEEPGILRQWDTERGQQLRQFALSDLETLWTFSSQAQLLASASDDLALWNVATGELLAGITQPSWVTAVAFSPDQSQIATGHDDHMVRLWDVASRQLIRELPGHQLPVSALAFRPDGLCLASAGEDRTVTLWDLAQGKPLRSLVGHTDRIPALAWHPRGDLLVSAGWDTTARVWDVDTGDPVILLNSHADQVLALAFSPDGQWLACADSANAIHVWDPVSWTTQRVLKVHTDEVRCLAFGRGRQLGALGVGPSLLLASGGSDRVLHLWDLRRGQMLSNPDQSARHSLSVCVSRDGPRLVSNGGGSGLRLWDLASGQSLVQAQAGGGGLHAVACSPDGRCLASGGSDGLIRIWDAADGRLLNTFQGQSGPVAALAWSPNSALVASACASDGTVWVWHVASAKPVLLIPEAADGCSVEALAFHPNSRWLACGGIDWLATGGTDGAICLWDVERPDRLALLDRGTRALAFHPSGNCLAAASLEEAVYIWDVKGQSLYRELGGHKEGVNCVAYSGDGRLLVSGSEDRMLRFWDADSGQLLAEHELDTPIKTVCFAPDGLTLFTGNGNTTCYQLEVKRLLQKG